MNLIDGIKEFLTYSALEKGCAPQTIGWYKQNFRWLLKFMESKFIKPTLEDITVGLLREYFYEQKRRGLKSVTLKIRQTALRGFFNFCKRQEYIKENPLSKMDKIKVPKMLPIFLTEEEARRLIQTTLAQKYDRKLLIYRNKVIIGLFLFCGLRIGELFRLEVKHVDIAAGILKVPQGKGNTDSRMIPLNNIMKKWLEEYLAFISKDGYANSGKLLVSSFKDKALTDYGVRRLLKQILAKANLGKRISPHKLRHTFASLMLQGGCDLRSLQEMLGHTNIATTSIYLHCDMSHLRRVINKHPLNFNYSEF